MLSVECFGRGAPERMEIVRLSYKRSAKVISREDFCGQLRRVSRRTSRTKRSKNLHRVRPGALAVRIVCARYFAKGPIRGAFLAVRDEESQDAIESSLTFALLWLEHCKKSAFMRQ